MTRAGHNASRPGLALQRRGRLVNRLRLLLARHQIGVALAGGAVFAVACAAYLILAVGAR